VLHRSRETSHAMTAAVATPRADPDLAPAIPRTTAAGVRAQAAASPATSAHTRPIAARFAAQAASRPVAPPRPHAKSRAGTA
jgi:hypothetical protein